MPKKTIIILIILVLLLVAGFFGVFYYFNRGGETPLGETLRDILPFGLTPEDVGFGGPSLPDFRDEEDRGGEFSDGSPTPDSEGAIFQNLRQLTTVPVSGAFASTTPDGTVVFYVERQTGHVYEIRLKNPSKKRLTNTTIPGVEEAFFGGRGEAVLVRYLDENEVIKTFKGVVKNPESSPEGTLDGSFLVDDISLVAISPGKEQFFIWVPFGKVSVGTVSQFGTGSNKEVFTSAFDQWLVEWPGDTILSFATKPSSGIDGFLYFLNPMTGAFNKILGGLSGLTARVSSDGARVVYSESDGTLFIKTSLYTVTTKTRADFPVRTLPEKCAWSMVKSSTLYCGVPQEIPESEYPDAWYQGFVSFSDALWKIDAETGTVDILATPETLARQEIDLVRPMLDKNEEYLIFTNKKDGTLWGLKL